MKSVVVLLFGIVTGRLIIEAETITIVAMLVSVGVVSGIIGGIKVMEERGGRIKEYIEENRKKREEVCMKIRKEHRGYVVEEKGIRERRSKVEGNIGGGEE